MRSQRKAPNIVSNYLILKYLLYIELPCFSFFLSFVVNTNICSYIHCCCFFDNGKFQTIWEPCCKDMYIFKVNFILKDSADPVVQLVPISSHISACKLPGPNWAVPFLDPVLERVVPWQKRLEPRPCSREGEKRSPQMFKGSESVSGRERATVPWWIWLANAVELSLTLPLWCCCSYHCSANLALGCFSFSPHHFWSPCWMPQLYFSCVDTRLLNDLCH